MQKLNYSTYKLYIEATDWTLSRIRMNDLFGPAPLLDGDILSFTFLF